jgi:hypothetical protein
VLEGAQLFLHAGFLHLAEARRDVIGDAGRSDLRKLLGEEWLEVVRRLRKIT